MLVLAATQAVADGSGTPTLLGTVLTAAAAVVAGGLVWALAALRRLLDARANLGAVWAIGARTAELAHAVAQQVTLGLTADLRAALVDGRIDDTERRALVSKAVSLARQALTANGFRTLEKVLGVASEGASAYLESAVASALERRVAAMATPTLGLSAPLASPPAATAARP